jgi:hypothetical protein
MKNILNRTLVVLAAGFMISSCEKNAIDNNAVPVTAGSHIKMVHAAQEAPMANLFVGNEKVSAIAPNAQNVSLGLSYTGTAVFPVSYGYANVAAGPTNVQIIDTVGAKGTAVILAAKSVSLDAASSYTAFLTGKTGSFEAHIIKDELPELNYTKAYVRFVNVMVDAPANFELKANFKATATKPATSTPIGADIAYKQHTPFIAIEPGTYDFPVFVQGATTAYTTMTNITPVAGRVYTFYIRGNYTASPAVANRVLIRDR